MPRDRAARVRAASRDCHESVMTHNVLNLFSYRFIVSS